MHFYAIFDHVSCDLIRCERNLFFLYRTIKAYLDCVKEYNDECEFDDFGIYASEREFMKVRYFITDICDENSSLHKSKHLFYSCL